MYLGVINQKEEIPDEFCKICSKVLNTKNFCYSCLDCEFGVHTFCATNEVKPELYVVGDDSVPDSGATSSNSQATAVSEPTAEEVIVELYNLQLQMQMAQGLAQMMASFNPSLS